jgi:hypothetical protein
MSQKVIYKVKFREKDQGKPTEALVRQVFPSDIPGLVCLQEFVMKDNVKKIILPDEDAASKRFRKTKSLHIPYHNILFIEEMFDEPVDVKQLPFLKEVADEQVGEKKHD